MRRFVYKDEEHDVKVLVDIPEELFIQIRQKKQKLEEAIKNIARYTIDKEKAHESEAR